MQSDDHLSNSNEAAPGSATDLDLMLRLCRRDNLALADLYERYSPILLALFIRSLQDRMEAEDALLDLFIEVWERADRYDPGRGSPRGYLFGLARSRIVDRLRSRRSRQAVAHRSAARDGNPADSRSPADSPIHSILFAESRAQVIAALESLPEDQRIAIEMAYFDAMTHVEVAQALGAPVGTVKSRIRQAMIRLRQLLAGDRPESRAKS